MTRGARAALENEHAGGHGSDAGVSRRGDAENPEGRRTRAPREGQLARRGSPGRTVRPAYGRASRAIRPTGRGAVRGDVQSPGGLAGALHGARISNDLPPPVTGRKPLERRNGRFGISSVCWTTRIRTSGA